VRALLLLLVALPSVALAQPVDPYGEVPPADDEVDTAVSLALIARARVLAGEGQYADAKQLVVEALVRTPGDAEAKAFLVELNRRLGIVDPPPPRPVEPPPPPLELPPDGLIDRAGPDTGYVRPGAFTRYVGGVVGGAVAGGLFADVVTGLDGTSEGQVLTGMVLGAAAGTVLARGLGKAELTKGDFALVNSMTAWGLAGGLMFGFALDPPEGEAYSLNGVLGIAGGYFIGHAAARKTDVSTARMARVNLAAFVGVAAPWLLYAAVSDDSTSDDEQAFGWLSTLGLVGGVYLGFRWTRDMKPGSEVDALEADRPIALFEHGRAGWRAGGLSLMPLQGAARGGSLSLASGTW
jgi:hypothetical protein